MVSSLTSFVERLSHTSARYAAITVVFCLLLSCGAIASTTAWLKFNSDKESLVAETAPFKARNARFNAAFPEFENSLLIVIDGATSSIAQTAAEKIGEKLRTHPQAFRSVFLGSADPFYRENGLLFLSTSKLETLSNALALRAPALASFASEPHLGGILSLVRLGATSEQDATQFELFLDDLLATAHAIERNETLPDALSLFGSDQTDRRRVLVLQPKLDFSSQSAERDAVNLVRSIVEGPEILGLDVRVRLTGRVALADDEIWAIQDSVALAGVLSTLFAGLLLWIAFRSFRMIFAVLFTLTIGLTWTMGLAALVVGSLNMISAAVIVLFIGLGIDHSIHFTFRYREALRSGDDPLEAIRVSAHDLSAPILLCAITSAVGFAAFIPTEYRGLAELGLIASGSIFLAVITSFTLLPALLLLTKAEQDYKRGPNFDRPGIASWLTEHSQFLSLAFAVIAILSILATGQPRFDFSTLAIRDQMSESIVTLQELQSDGFLTEYAAEILVDDTEELATLIPALQNLPEVENVYTPTDQVPEEQDLKLEILADMNGFLWPALNPPAMEAASPPNFHRLVSEFAVFASTLGDERASHVKVKQLAAILTSFAAARTSVGRLEVFEQAISEPLSDELEQLQQALRAQAVRFEDLPPSVQQRYIGQNGEIRVTAISNTPLLDTTSLETFVSAVRSVAPNATGRAFSETDVGTLVVRAFYEAGVVALFGIILLLFLVLRSVRDSFFVILPLLLAACYTLASAALFNISFNFANIIVLPLIFGLGVDSAIHFVMRRRAAQNVDFVLHTSTPQAILFSALSTIGAFSALSFSRHWGLASMGILLTIAVFWVIISTIIILPALMDGYDKIRKRNSA